MKRAILFIELAVVAGLTLLGIGQGLWSAGKWLFNA